MKNNKLHSPDGVTDYLPLEYSQKAEIESRIMEVYRSYGYETVSTPTFEYMEVFDGKGSISEKQMYKFIDRNGAIMALRSDMTLPIGRIAATNFSETDIPLRFSYLGNAFRHNLDYQGKLCEFTQAGIELIGVNSQEANAEVIAVAIKSLLASGLSDFRIDIGQVQFITGLLEETGFDAEKQLTLKNHLIARDFVAIEEIVNDSGMPYSTLRLFQELPLLIGNETILDEAMTGSLNQKSREALESLKKLYELIKNYGLEQYIQFDLSMVGNLDYYTGIIFRGYTYGTGFWVVDGGRYDTLLSQFGTDLPSVGFAIEINDLMSALAYHQQLHQEQKTKLLLIYTEETARQALSYADKLRKSGEIIENSLFGEDLTDNIAYARSKGLEILYFKDAATVQRIDSATGTVIGGI